MLCPLMTGRLTRQERAMYTAGDCQQANCAWWHTSYERCALWVIAEQVDAAAHNILVASGHEPPPPK